MAFSVNDEGKQVKFAPGNLYWDGTQFKFETHQYDYPTTWDASHVGHFYWSKTASIAYAEEYGDNGKSSSDKFFAADGGAVEGYTVLSIDEWSYLFEHSLAKNSSSKNEIIIDGKNCLVLKPDGFSGTVADTYTAEQWATAEASGLVALPFAGTRDGSSFNGAGTRGSSWSSTPYSYDRACKANFNSDDASISHIGRIICSSVRLVSVQ